MKDFIALCKRTESLRQPPVGADAARLLHAGMGMVTESGEFLDALKKSYFYGRALDRTNLLEEIGDELWYIAIALDVLDSDFETEMDRVIRKLRTRFPAAYSDVDANLRDLAAERKELEK